MGVPLLGRLPGSCSSSNRAAIRSELVTTVSPRTPGPEGITGRAGGGPVVARGPVVVRPDVVQPLPQAGWLGASVADVAVGSDPDDARAGTVAEAVDGPAVRRSPTRCRARPGGAGRVRRGGAVSSCSPADGWPATTVAGRTVSGNRSPGRVPWCRGRSSPDTALARWCPARPASSCTAGAMTLRQRTGAGPGSAGGERGEGASQQAGRARQDRPARRPRSTRRCAPVSSRLGATRRSPRRRLVRRPGG